MHKSVSMSTFISNIFVVRGGEAVRGQEDESLVAVIERCFFPFRQEHCVPMGSRMSVVLSWLFGMCIEFNQL